MLNGGGLLRQFLPAGIAAETIAVDPVYQPLSQLQLSKLLRTAAANQEGSSVTASQTADNPTPLFAVDNNRFIHFCRNTSGHPAYVIVNVTTGTPAINSTTAIRAAAATIIAVKRNPLNALQFAVLCSDGYTHLVTVAASGTTATVSSHNTVGSVAGLVYSTSGADIVWALTGDSFLVWAPHATRWQLILFTASGTTLAYVTVTSCTNTITTGYGVGARIGLTGNASNEVVASAGNNSGGTQTMQIARATFTTTAITLAMHISSTPSPGTGGTVTTQQSEVSIAGSIHSYGLGTSPFYLNRIIVDGSGSGVSWFGSVSAGDFPAAANQGNAVESAAQFGEHTGNFSAVGASATATNSTFLMINRLGIGFIGAANLFTRSTQSVMGMCVSLDYSKMLLVVNNATTYTYVGFSTVTT